ncbi:hypothetical protein BGZ95_006889, partial [Linnemannia exigua]
IMESIRDGVANTEDPVKLFAEEAKFFVEYHLLRREHPARNFAEALVAQGLAKVTGWSITHVTGSPEALRAA